MMETTDQALWRIAQGDVRPEDYQREDLAGVLPQKPFVRPEVETKTLSFGMKRPERVRVVEKS